HSENCKHRDHGRKHGRFLADERLRRHSKQRRTLYLYRHLHPRRRRITLSSHHRNGQCVRQPALGRAHRYGNECPSRGCAHARHVHVPGNHCWKLELTSSFQSHELRNRCARNFDHRIHRPQSWRLHSIEHVRLKRSREHVLHDHRHVRAASCWPPDRDAKCERQRVRFSSHRRRKWHRQCSVHA